MPSSPASPAPAALTGIDPELLEKAITARQAALADAAFSLADIAVPLLETATDARDAIAADIALLTARPDPAQQQQLEALASTADRLVALAAALAKPSD